MNRRRNIWLYLGEVENLKQEYSKNKCKIFVYVKLSEILVYYETLRNQTCSQEEKIKNDVKRSFGNHEFFKENV